MRADIALKEQFNISRQKAKELIENGNVTINNTVVKKPSLEVSNEDILKIEQSDILKYVGRGGLKLERALTAFGIKPEGLVCLDIGASTGGFTDCLLQKGAKKVYALDVGSSQLAESLKADSRVICMENTDIRQAELEPVDFICMDVSFISLTKVLYKVKELLKAEGEAVILIKPQFEAGRQYLNKKGIVKDNKIHKKVLRAVLDHTAELQLNAEGIIPSPIKGGDGNREYLLYITKAHGSGFMPDIDSVILSGEEIK